MFKLDRLTGRRADGQTGFTLIELLIVIAVIGILAAAILPRFVSFSKAASVGATKGALSSIRAALAIYQGKNDGATPTNLSDLVTTYLDSIPPEQVENCTGVLGDEVCDRGTEDNTEGASFDEDGGWWYTGGVVRVDETHASAW